MGEFGRVLGEFGIVRESFCGFWENLGELKEILGEFVSFWRVWESLGEFFASLGEFVSF